ncbi:MAG TPA: SRPBCC family protein [Azospira sp.]|nr:SRPBCC family protein [Azospira sp.]
MAEYHLLTTWRVEAPLERAYQAIHDSPRWPDWWQGVQRVERVATGDADGIGSVWRYFWRGRLPYRVVFDVCVTRVDTQLAIEGSTRGDLEGVGRWDFSGQGTVTTIRCEWHVHSTRWWMNLIAPVARSVFIRNHARVMEQGARGLAGRLGAPLLSQETVDLLAAARPAPASAAPGRWRQQGRIDPLVALIVGVGAGVVATIAQLLLWWLAGMPVLDTLLRDARLTAALVMGSRVLPPPSTAHWDILLVATLIHFALSIGYAVIAVPLTARLRTGPALLVGALYGLLIYALNLYGLTLLFPWFAVARDGVTLLTHVVFGVALAGGCRLLAKPG